MNLIYYLILGIAIGFLVFWFFDYITFNNKELNKDFWDNPKSWWGYKLHHSVIGAILIILGIIELLFIKRYTKISLSIIGFGIGMIAIHTITDGRFVFIEKIESYLKYAKKQGF